MGVGQLKWQSATRRPELSDLIWWILNQRKRLEKATADTRRD